MRLTTLALAISLAACGSSKPPAPTPAAVPPTNVPAQTGPLSEAEFKALHELPATEPAPRKGQHVQLADGSRAYLSLPAGTGPFPGIVVVHEWWGLNGHIEQWTDRLASAGWAALAVDLYGGKVATTRDDAMAMVKAVEPPKAIATLRAGHEFLAKDPRIAAKKRAVIGWCFGGAYSLQTALAIPDLDGAIIYYGQLETDPKALSAIKAQVLGIFGNQDTGIPPEAVNQFEAGLKQANVRSEIHRYDAAHGFANPSNPKYDAKSSEDAWNHVLAFLDRLAKGA